MYIFCPGMSLFRVPFGDLNGGDPGFWFICTFVPKKGLSLSLGRAPSFSRFRVWVWGWAVGFEVTHNYMSLRVYVHLGFCLVSRFRVCVRVQPVGFKVYITRSGNSVLWLLALGLCAFGRGSGVNFALFRVSCISFPSSNPSPRTSWLDLVAWGSFVHGRAHYMLHSKILTEGIRGFAWFNLYLGSES